MTLAETVLSGSTEERIPSSPAPSTPVSGCGASGSSGGSAVGLAGETTGGAGGGSTAGGVAVPATTGIRNNAASPRATPIASTSDQVPHRGRARFITKSPKSS